MSLFIEKCRNGFLLLPSGGSPADAFYLADVPEAIKDAFKAEEEAKTVRAQLKSIASDLSDLPTLDQAVTDRIAA